MLSNMKVLIGLLVIIAGLAYWAMQDSQVSDEPKPLIPAWQKQPNALAEIDQLVLSQSGEQIELKKMAGNWVLDGGFYASIDPLFNLLQSLKNAEVVEAKTANAENHALVGLSVDGLKVELFGNNNLLQAFHVGNKSKSGLTFVRRVGEDQTYTVKGLDDIMFNQDSWQLKTVLDVPSDEIQSILIKPNSGNELDVSRDPANGLMAINNMPAGHQKRADASLDQLASGLSRLMIDEALPLDLSEKVMQLTAQYTLKQGQEIIVKVYQKDDSYLMVIESGLFPHYAGWMMRIAEYKFKAFNRELSEFIEPITDEQMGDVDSGDTLPPETPIAK